MGTADRVIRTAAAALIIALYVGGWISGATAIVLGIVAGAFLLTSVVGWCPAYLLFGFSTRRSSSEASHDGA